MGKVEFYEENSLDAPRRGSRTSTSGLVRLVIKLGWVKNEAQANRVLVIITILALSASAAIVIFNR